MPDLRTIAIASTTTEKSKTNKKQCSLFALPPELRDVIFIMVAQDLLETTPIPCRYMQGFPCPGHHEVECQPLVYPEYRQYTKPSDLELAFYNYEMQLYFECLHARLGITKLVFSSSNNDDDYQCFSSFGNEIPIWILDSVRSIRYELDHRLKFCNKTEREQKILRKLDEWAEPPDFEPPAGSPDPWCNTQFCSFRESVRALARSLQTKGLEDPHHHPDRLLSVEVYGLCESCSDRIQDCDNLFDELLGFKGEFVPDSKIRASAMLHFRPRVRRYRHPMHVQKVLPPKFLEVLDK